MKTAGRLVALGGLLAASGQAKVLRWQHDDGSSTWTPARETPLLMNSAMVLGVMPTPAPQADRVEEELRKRARNENTCAYISGNPTDTLSCQAPGKCIYNDFLSLVGCCDKADPADCTIASTCYHRTESAKIPAGSTSGFYYCGQAAFPSCVTYVFTGNTWNQYNLFGCGVTAAVIDVDVNPASSTIESEPPFSTPTPTPTPPVPPPVPKKKSNTGAIVGGTVGGIAIIAAAGLAGAFLWRKKKRDETPTPTSPTTTMAGMGGYTNPTSPMQENTAGYPPGFVAADNRTSMAKMPYNYEPSHISPPASPPPQGYPSGIPVQFPSVNPGQHQYPAVVEQPYPPVAQPQYLPYQPPQPTYPQHTGAVEMPTTRGDNELRELA